MFKREHHLRIASVLQNLNPNLLDKYFCYFGGGTAIVLSKNEYRESVDIDFMCSELSGYRNLRENITAKGINFLARSGAELHHSRDIRTDQYGIRTFIEVGEIQIKFEIIFEARLSFDKPSNDNRISGVSTLSKLDLGACKLLAHSDRGKDRSTFCRDLIDLAMLDLDKKTFKMALNKSKEAYGDSVEIDLTYGIEQFQQNPNRLDECMDALQIETISKALLWKKLRSLEKIVKK